MHTLALNGFEDKPANLTSHERRFKPFIIVTGDLNPSRQVRAKSCFEVLISI